VVLVRGGRVKTCQVCVITLFEVFMTLQEWKIEDRAVPNTALRDQKEEAKTCPEEEVQHHVPYQLTPFMEVRWLQS